ncbi:LysR family transcriptional regulator [Clostridium sp. AF18-27]|uniref:DNA-binding transcriptional regulator, LysR family n=1 Tax=Enterocloster lavalensis TaxID=460384 RepID=A0A1I0IP92_9FIRM|nr:LysR family transcriptional regulator [Enterocloster lavalensis]MBS5605926.1 LysR family transcriptional regulator [Enterocloster asparagiformis]PST33648.1 LysR family transcriptional regulator [Enterocloster lavalensis]RHR50854.1 LysR family transcriptional regulator [Clostridium sp. AF18-27]SET98236.1 DNA-binding transcriptional regulator, LysR family [Enterocloster lavalensis]
MDSKQIQYILKVAECQNITRAAEQLYVSQPALSHFISKAEEELGAKIFNRGTTPLTLTQAGEHYVKTARMMMALEENLRQEIDDLNNSRDGEIRLGLSDMRATSLLPFALPEFRRLYPNVTIKTVESGSRTVEDNVRNGLVDLGIIPLYDYGQDLCAKVLYDEELLLVSSEDLPCERGNVRPWVDIEEVTGRDFALLTGDNRLRRAVDAVFLEHGVKPRTVMESRNNMTVYMLATSGMALAIVPETVVRMMNPVRIPRIYSIGKSGFHWNIGAIRREDAVLSGAQEQLIRLLRNRYL